MYSIGILPLHVDGNDPLGEVSRGHTNAGMVMSILGIQFLGRLLLIMGLFMIAGLFLMGHWAVLLLEYVVRSAVASDSVGVT